MDTRSQDLGTTYLRELFEAFKGGQKQVFQNVFKSLGQRNPQLLREMLLSAKKSEVVALAKELKLNPGIDTTAKLKKFFASNRINHARMVGELAKELKADPNSMAKLRVSLDKIKAKGIKMPSVARCAAGLSLYVATGDWWHSYYSSFLGPSGDDEFYPTNTFENTTETLQNMSTIFMGVMCLSEMVFNKERYKQIIDRIKDGNPNKSIEELVALTKLVEENPKDAEKLSRMKFFQDFDDVSKLNLAKDVIEHGASPNLHRHTDEAWSQFVFEGELSKVLRAYVEQLPIKDQLEIAAHSSDLGLQHGLTQEYVSNMQVAEFRVRSAFLNWLSVHRSPEEFERLKAEILKLPLIKQENWEELHSIDPQRRLTLTGLGLSMTMLSYQAALGLNASIVDRAEDIAIRAGLLQGAGYMFGALVGGSLLWERLYHFYHMYKGRDKDPEPGLMRSFQKSDVDYLLSVANQARADMQISPLPTKPIAKALPTVENAALQSARVIHDLREIEISRSSPIAYRALRRFVKLTPSCLLALTRSR